MSLDNKKSRAEQEIDKNLRRAFDDISKQDVPDRFAQLLASLKDAETSAQKGSENDE